MCFVLLCRQHILNSHPNSQEHKHTAQLTCYNYSTTHQPLPPYLHHLHGPPMRKAEESEQHALLQQKQYNARRFQEQREINAVASSFGSLFHKTAKFHYYTPVHPSHEQSTTATATNTTTEANNNNAASLTSPSNIERLRKTRTRQRKDNNAKNHQTDHSAQLSRAVTILVARQQPMPNK